jgi:hypothetical protein
VLPSLVSVFWIRSALQHRLLLLVLGHTHTFTSFVTPHQNKPHTQSHPTRTAHYAATLIQNSTPRAVAASCWAAEIPTETPTRRVADAPAALPTFRPCREQQTSLQAREAFQLDKTFCLLPPASCLCFARRLRWATSVVSWATALATHLELRSAAVHPAASAQRLPCPTTPTQRDTIDSDLHPRPQPGAR